AVPLQRGLEVALPAGPEVALELRDRLVDSLRRYLELLAYEELGDQPGVDERCHGVVVNLLSVSRWDLVPVEETEQLAAGDLRVIDRREDLVEVRRSRRGFGARRVDRGSLGDGRLGLRWRVLCKGPRAREAPSTSRLTRPDHIDTRIERLLPDGMTRVDSPR